MTWNSTFKDKPRKRMARVSKNKANVDLRAKKKHSKRAQNAALPAWIRAIPESTAHGSGSLQKRLWRATSDLVRIRDWHRYRACVATGNPIASWKDGQAGHFIGYTSCNGLFKFDPRNIHLQSSSSNSWGRREDWNRYEKELEDRYGKSYVMELEIDNRASSLKFTTAEVIAELSLRLEDLANLPEQPDWYARAAELRLLATGNLP